MWSDWRTECREAVRTNARLLRVPEPRVVPTPSAKFLTPTTRAALSDDGKVIAVNRDSAFPDRLSVWLVVSHEMRHLWQMRHGRIRSGYAPASDLPLGEYNGQGEEIDAHAWAVVVIASVFGIRPTLEKNLGEEIWKRIETRAAQIAAEYNGKK